MQYQTRYSYVRVAHADYLVVDGKTTPGKVIAHVKGWEAYANVETIVKALEAYNKNLYSTVLGEVESGDGAT